MLLPHPIDLSVAFGAFTVLDPQFSHLKTPALDHRLAAAVTKRIFSGIAGNIAGEDIF